MFLKKKTQTTQNNLTTALKLNLVLAGGSPVAFPHPTRFEVHL